MAENKEKATKAGDKNGAPGHEDESGKESAAQQEPKEKSDKKKEGKTDHQLEELGQKLLEMNDKYLRLSAEFDNYRKRTLKEKMDLTKTAGEQILSEILPVVDNFERALASLEKTDDVESVRKGVELIYSSFKDFLKQNGVTEINCVDTDFDTDVHEAVAKIPATDEKSKGKVMDCIQKGYKLNDKVMRFAKVVVGE